MSDAKTSRFADRLRFETYAADPQIHFGIAASGRAPDAWLSLPERLIARLTNLGTAYELHHVQMIDIYDDTTLKSQQCEKLYLEISFLAGVVNDPALAQALEALARLIKPALGKPLHLTISGN